LLGFSHSLKISPPSGPLSNLFLFFYFILLFSHPSLFHLALVILSYWRHPTVWHSEERKYYSCLPAGETPEAGFLVLLCKCI
jgi:hypothetical protein